MSAGATTRHRSDLRGSRRQEFAGLFGAVVRAALLLVAVNLDWRLWASDPGARSALEMVAFLVAAANLTVLGVLVLVSGLRRERILGDRRARQGVVVKLAAANMLFPVLAVAVLVESAPLNDVPFYVLLVALVAWNLVAGTGVRLLRRGWKYDTASGELFRADSPHPVLYLRSFIDDDPTGRRTARARWWVKFVGWMKVFSVEQELAQIFRRVGPFVALGKAGDSLPELARRECTSTTRSGKKRSKT